MINTNVAVENGHYISKGKLVKKKNLRRTPKKLNKLNYMVKIV